MVRRSLAQHYLLMMVCCLKSCSSFMVNQKSHACRVVNAAQQVRRVWKSTIASGFLIPIETSCSSLQLEMSVSVGETMTSNLNKTITVAVRARLEQRRQTESDDDDPEYEAPAPTMPLVLTLTGIY